MEREKLYGLILKTTIAVPPKENQTAAMLKSRIKGQTVKALGWNKQEVLLLNSTFPKIRESGLCVIVKCVLVGRCRKQ